MNDRHPPDIQNHSPDPLRDRLVTHRCESAVRRATLLAKQMDALLLLVHVVDEAQPPEIIERQLELARIALEARQLTSAADFAIRIGRPNSTIARVVGEWDPDLVVLGAYRERSGERLFGTTAERVIRTGARPVLLVNRESSGSYREVLLASDPSDAFAEVICMTQQLGLLEGATTSIVHVLAQATRSMFYPAWTTKSEIDQLMHSLRWTARRAPCCPARRCRLGFRPFLHRSEARFGDRRDRERGRTGQAPVARPWCDTPPDSQTSGGGERRT
jgi:nucleotide-binding universal stress UspA family protein